MIDRKTIEAILAQYKKHGWELRRVLLSDGFKEQVAGLDEIFAGADVRSSELDAIWFSRASRPGATAWEIRRLTESPFALVVALQDGAGSEDSEAILKGAEMQMLEGRRNQKKNPGFVIEAG
jgi:hypothetical protein